MQCSATGSAHKQTFQCALPRDHDGHHESPTIQNGPGGVSFRWRWFEVVPTSKPDRTVPPS